MNTVLVIDPNTAAGLILKTVLTLQCRKNYIVGPKRGTSPLLSGAEREACAERE